MFKQALEKRKKVIDYAKVMMYYVSKKMYECVGNRLLNILFGMYEM